MSNLVVVAIPAEDELVWQISSEKVPHVTLLFLGEVGKVKNIDKILSFLQHASDTMQLRPFYLDVDHRGVLGGDEADVLFFEGSWDLPKLKEFRGMLLKNDAINQAFISEDQFPEWVPHLTLGYPATPAKKLPVEVDRRLYSVRFDRIALWYGDYEGPEFRLKERRYNDEDPPMAMSTPVDDILSHYGTKGMRWGVRKRDYSPTNVEVKTTPKGKVKVKGGKNQPTHSDAIVAKVAVQKAKKSGIDSLSNDELRALTTRLNLEKKVSDLAKDQMTGTGRKVIQAFLAEIPDN